MLRGLMCFAYNIQMTQNEAFKVRMEEAERLVEAQDERLFDVLAALLADAERNEDQLLQGFVHYQYASAYFDLEDEENMLSSLRKALGFLLICNAGEWISRSYNLFAVYTKQMGFYDMAYNYFTLSYSYVKADEESLSRGILESNFGDLLADMGDYRRACTLARKGLKTFEHLADSRQVRMYRVFGTVNLGLYRILEGNLSQASNMLDRAKKMLEGPAGDAGDMVLFWYRMVQTRLLLAQENRGQIRELTEDINRQISEKQYFAMFAREIRQFGDVLIDAGETEAAQRLIAVAERTDGSMSTVYVRMMLARLKSHYCHAAGEGESFARARAEYRLLLKELERTKRSLSLKSAKLMLMNENIRRERNRLREENARLYELARTDALTSLPNRYALNEYMDAAFEKALREQTVFGFGIVDIDTFKQYNDTFGHAAGDACLQSVANVLKEIAQEYGFFVSRYGGDEFTMVYENLDHATIRQIEKEIYARVEIPVSHGYYADIPDENSRQWDYMTTADTLMYKRKRGS